MYECDQTSAGGRDNSGEVFIWIVGRTLSASVVVFLRRDFGELFLGIPGVLVLLVVPIFAGCFPKHDPRPLLWFVALYFGMCIVTRIGRFRLERRGLRCHSQYSGTPRLLSLLPSVPEVTIKRWIEPPLVILTGLLLFEWNEPLSSYLVWAGCALAIIEHMNGMSDKHQIVRMHDAYLEQSHTNERFRRMRSGAY